MANFWATADNQFDSVEAAEERDFDSVETMNAFMILQWNNIVGHNDVVYHLGEFGNPEFVKKLNGFHISVIGEDVSSIPSDFVDEVKEAPVIDAFDAADPDLGLFLVAMSYYQMSESAMNFSDADINLFGGESEETVDVSPGKTKANIFINVNAERWDYIPVSDNMLELFVGNL